MTIPRDISRDRPPREPVQDPPDCPAGDPEFCPLPSDYANTDAWRLHVAQEVAALRAKHDLLADGLASNTELTQQVYENTRVIVEAVHSAGEMWAFLSRWGKRLGKFLRWAAKWASIVAGIMLVAVQIGEISSHNHSNPVADALRKLFGGSK